MRTLNSGILFASFKLASGCFSHVAQQSHSIDSMRRSMSSEFSKTALRDVRVFDGSCFTPPQTIIIDKGVISSNTDNIETSINATGLFLIPGLIDSHIHISSTIGLEEATSFGITTAMNMACEDYMMCESLKGLPGLSDFRTAGIPAVGPNTSHAAMLQLPPSKLVTETSNATELVDWAKTNGSNYFKITLEPNGPSYDLTRRLVAAAETNGLPVMAHASDMAAFEQAVETNVAGIQHVPRDGNLTNELIQLSKNANQFVTPTLAIFAAALHPPNPIFLQFLSANSSSNSSSNSSWENVVHNVRALYHARIPLLAGTDAVGTIAPNVSIPYGETLHRELEYYVDDIGMTPAEAINSATRLAAEHHGLRDRGVIEDGMRADLLLLESDPLLDIRNTRKIVGVWAGGRKYEG
ncbi:unnamed protein product [Periconia digitata]|uniref:Amidohydrolase-related domain-containing protein n=1 Tax=Periconia digitata TaxID=1303443 RepID=A0A9W4XH58_9PLEO|nr:unnamed protein product [Periconia digitata]